MKNIKHVNDLSLVEVKQMLKEKKKEKELNYEQKMCLDHANLFSKLTNAKMEKMNTELIEKCEITNEIAKKITDILPNKIQLDLIAEKNKCITNENKELILEIIEKYKK
jgi:DNA-directed RNA polymerase subunit F